eukprot:scaffold197112_cov34-Tisochrysis_lutea.AAC.2
MALRHSALAALATSHSFAAHCRQVELAREEATAAIEWVNSPACPPEEREWLEQLQDALNDANDAAGGQMATD